MKNMEQIRAHNALLSAGEGAFAGADGGEVAKKVPAYIRTNGFLCALAFALEKGKGYEKAFTAIARHLACAEVGLTRGADAGSLLKELCEAQSSTLRMVTSETMLYLNYLRRFARKNNEEG